MDYSILMLFHRIIILILFCCFSFPISFPSFYRCIIQLRNSIGITIDSKVKTMFKVVIIYVINDGMGDSSVSMVIA